MQFGTADSKRLLAETSVAGWSVAGLGATIASTKLASVGGLSAKMVLQPLNEVGKRRMFKRMPKNRARRRLAAARLSGIFKGCYFRLCHARCSTCELRQASASEYWLRMSVPLLDCELDEFFANKRMASAGPWVGRNTLYGVIRLEGVCRNLKRGSDLPHTLRSPQRCTKLTYGILGWPHPAWCCLHDWPVQGFTARGYHGQPDRRHIGRRHRWARPRQECPRGARPGQASL